MTETTGSEWFQAHFSFAATRMGGLLAPHVELRGSHILDLGCGDGILDLGLALRYGPSHVMGIDVMPPAIGLAGLARREIGLEALPRNLSFSQITVGAPLADFGPCDVVVSWSAFEHIDRAWLTPILKDCFEVLRPRGLLFIQIDPLYYSPFGSHLARFGQAPWEHLALDQHRLEERVMAYAGPIAADELDTNYEACGLEAWKRHIVDEYRKLNRLTPDEIATMVRAAGFETLRELRTRCTLDPPPQLLEKHSRVDLMTSEIILIARRP
jgi:SAM-dependent methyltransferase